MTIERAQEIARAVEEWVPPPGVSAALAFAFDGTPIVYLRPPCPCPPWAVALDPHPLAPSVGAQLDRAAAEYADALESLHREALRESRGARRYRAALASSEN